MKRGFLIFPLGCFSSHVPRPDWVNVATRSVVIRVPIDLSRFMPSQDGHTPLARLDTPPRLHAKPVCFYAAMRLAGSRTDTGLHRGQPSAFFHAESCESNRWARR